MLFAEKADYQGAYDPSGIPQLDYHGRIGLQYNPIAIAQFGLGNYNLCSRTGDSARRTKFFQSADWLASNLEQNPHGLWVWNHHFDWEYRETLKAPWYSALAQGQGISVLVRAHKESGDARYLDAAQRAFASFQQPIENGGVAFTDAARRSLARGIHRLPAHPHLEWIHLGPLGSLRSFPRHARRNGAGAFLPRRAHAPSQSRPLRSRILVALRAIRHPPAHGRKSVLSPAPHCAVADHAPADR